MTDVCLIHPGAAHIIYQDLSETLAALEPPVWTRMTAGWLRDRKFDVKIIDQEAENLSVSQVADRVKSMQPKLVVIVVVGHQPNGSTQQMTGVRGLATALDGFKTILIGHHVSALPERTLREEPVTYVCDGEGPVTIAGLLNNDPVHLIPGLVWRDGDRINLNVRAPLIPIDDLHGDVWDLLPMDKYRAHAWQCYDESPRQPYASIYTTLGCPYKCLAGDTLINTVYGDIPIRELAEKYESVPVFTFDPEKNEGLVSKAVKIRNYGKSCLVRVNFDDGTHIDCTPDHRFLQFKWGNSKSQFHQWQTEAKDLQPGSHVRAIRFEETKQGYIDVCWSRRGRRKRSRMIMDYLLGRRLSRHEYVHHKDHNKSNDAPENLEFCKNAKEHLSHHPEIVQRMRFDNPVKNMTPEWREKLRLAITGKKRSLEARVHYRNSKLGEKNPNYKHGLSVGQPSRVARPNNHRVVSVEWLEGEHDVYCMTVPETGWFYANNVLVKNCHFCMINVFQHTNKYRRRSPASVVSQVEHLYREYGVSTFKFADEMFVLNENHYLPICEGLSRLPFADKLNIWCYARVDTVKPDTLRLLRCAGIRWICLGIESGSSYVRDGSHKTIDDNDIREVVKEIQKAGICVLGNFIFGLPNDTMESMRATLDLAKSIECEYSNFYAAQGYPGSQLFNETKPEDLPDCWAGYSQHSYECRPLPTATLTSADVLRFRDNAFHEYFEDPKYLDRTYCKFGSHAIAEVRKMTSTRLKRKILE